MKTKIGLALGLSLMASEPTYAQSSEFDRAFAPRGAEARVTLSIPFGGDQKTPKSKPQLALVGRHYRDDDNSVNWALKNPMGQETYTESRLAITLSSHPTLLLNDEALLHFSENQTHLSDDVKTAGKIALAAGALTAAVLAVWVVLYLHDYEDGT